MDLIIGKKTFKTTNKTFIMGILNITPDSFYDGGNYDTYDKALKQTEKLINEGADIVDIGAESTRPGHTPISASEEIRRLNNLVFEIKKRFDTPISIDTTKTEVAEFVLQQGADLINDISFLKNPKMVKIVAKFNATYCLMHNKKTTNDSQFIDEMVNEIKLKLEIAKNNGISKNKIVIDPGIGFNKTFDENWIALKNIPAIAKLGFPVLVGASNKSFIGNALNEPNVKLRTHGTVATTTIAAMLGANFIRVHDVKPNAQAIKVAESIKFMHQRTLI